MEQVKILLAECDDLMREAISEILKRDGLEIFHAKTGQEAMEIGRTAVPNIIISAIRLGTMSGLDLIKQVKQDPVTASIPVILLTGSITPETMSEANRLGAAAYLPKPVGVNLLLGTVSRILEKKRVD